MSVQPPEWAFYELLCMRIGFAVLLLIFGPRTVATGPMHHPVGLARVVDLTWFSDTTLQRRLRWVVFAGAVVFVVGVVEPVGIAVLTGWWLIGCTVEYSRGWVTTAITCR